VTNHLVLRPIPGATGGDADAYIDPAYFHQLFAQDLHRSTTQVMATTQRPGSLGRPGHPLRTASVEVHSELVPRGEPGPDHPVRGRRAMAILTRAKSVSINSSHVAMMTPRL
jgi:hypothetical protein